MNQREVGTRQESRAAEYLESLGYHILVRNFRCRFGEIDLIAKQDDTYIFIEVKYRTGRTAGDPTSAVDGKKQKKISKTADYYRMLHQIPMDVPAVSTSWQRHRRRSASMRTRFIIRGAAGRKGVFMIPIQWKQKR